MRLAIPGPLCFAVAVAGWRSLAADRQMGGALLVVVVVVVVAVVEVVSA